MKIQGYGQAKILTQAEIELLFKEGFQTERDRVLFGVCLYTACRIAEACSLMVKDIYTNSGIVRSTINFRKGNTKGKLQTRTIPVIEDLRSLLTSWRPNAGLTYFPVATLATIGNPHILMYLMKQQLHRCPPSNCHSPYPMIKIQGGL